jgi:hypothetical protein
MLLEHCARYRDLFRQDCSVAEHVWLLAVFGLYMVSDFLENLIRLRRCKDTRYRSFIDGLVLVYCVITFVLYETNPLGARFGLVIVGYVFWRIFAISVSKLQIIGEIGLPGWTHMGVSSFNRIVALTVLNLIELTLCFGYLYRYYGAVSGHENALLYTLGVFATQGFRDMDLSRTAQQTVAGLQLIVLIIFFALFIANIRNVKWKE